MVLILLGCNNNNLLKILVLVVLVPAVLRWLVAILLEQFRTADTCMSLVTSWFRLTVTWLGRPQRLFLILARLLRQSRILSLLLRQEY
jgi:hypothetical protein